jgi:hypothetical protein
MDEARRSVRYLIAIDIAKGQSKEARPFGDRASLCRYLHCVMVGMAVFAPPRVG